MAKSRGNRSQQPRGADGQFESKSQAATQSGGKSGMKSGSKSSPKSSGNRCRNDQGRFESCDS